MVTLPHISGPLKVKTFRFSHVSLGFMDLKLDFKVRNLCLNLKFWNSKRFFYFETRNFDVLVCEFSEVFKFFAIDVLTLSIQAFPG